MKHSEKGFTYLELMLVIGIIAIIVAFAIPNFRPVLYDARLEQAVQQLEADLMYARQLARTEKKACDVGFTEPGGYRIELAGSVVKTQELPSGTRWNPIPSSLRFNRDGSPGSSDITFWIEGSDGTRAGVNVYAGTGRVEVQYQ